MTPSKILIGQFAIVSGIIILANWIATQWVASSLHYQVGLGSVWFFIDEQPIYYPWRIYQWWYAYEAYSPSIFAQGGLIAVSGGVFGILAAVIGSIWRSRWEKNVSTFGSARWADMKDIKKANLFEEKGVFLGRLHSKYLRHNGPEHVLAFAPTRSGKGVGLVIPTLLSWPKSVVVHDIKGENWDITSGWRSKFGPCLKFDPTDLSSSKYNPLLEVRRGINEVRDVQNIADILVDPEGSLERRSHWDKTAHTLLVGVILHVLYAEKKKSLNSCALLLSHPKRSFELTLSLMLQTKHLGEEGVHPVIAQSVRELLNKSANERSGVLSTALSCLSLYRDPIISEITSASEWRVEDLVNTAQPVSLYLVVPPSDISRTKPLIRMILNQIGRRLTQELPTQARTRLLLMLDEFPALGRLDFFETSLAFLAGYGIRVYIIAQSLNQIEKSYGTNNSILDNCHVRIAFASNDERTAKRIADSLGTKTQLRAQKNYTGHRLAPWLSHMMVSRQETQRQLLTPGEVMQLSETKALIMIAGVPAIMAKKLQYFKDKNFIERVLPAPVRGGHLNTPNTDWYKALPYTGPNMSDLEMSSQINQEIQTIIECGKSHEHDVEVVDDRGENEVENIKRSFSFHQSKNDVFPEF
ncbi:IncP-type conjugal transfer protein TraG [Hirschia litorea]|uniref:IncP-type conjugal transfer protein TraG n=1 Tax=Hirschia litorea TaxID=1199156 RepID=A0ABW2IPX0_9PROT